MPFDGLVLAAVTRELKEKLVGGRIERVYQPSKDEIILLVHRPGFRGRLLLSANAKNARVHITTSAGENPATPPLFCMVLRKYLEGGRIISFTQPELERVFIMKIESRDEFGNPSPKHLICETMGKHSNIILVDPINNFIVDGIKRYSHSVSRYREVLPGRPYLSPPPQKKLNPFTVDEELFRLTSLKSPLDTPLPALLQKCLGGMSTVTCREIVFRANLSPDIILDQCGDYELRSLWRALQEFILPAGEGCFEPCLTCSPKGKFQDFAAINLTHTGLKRINGEMNFLLDLFFMEYTKNDRLKKEKNILLSLLNKEINKLGKKLDLYVKGLDETAGAGKLKLYGELLTANIYRLEKGLTEVSLENYYGNGPQVVTIPLNPHRFPSENAQSYFKQYLKAKNTHMALKTQIIRTREILDYVEGIKTALEQTVEISGLEEIRQELIEQGFIKQPLQKSSIRKKTKDKHKHKPVFLSFRSSDGFQLFAGKNNKQNDLLTLKLAQENDLWLHAKDIPGAHVIIRTEGKEVPQATLAEAASLAAYFSKARESKSVPVDYTKIKHVSKPNNARPGMVIYEQQKTIMGVPDEDLATRLIIEDKRKD
ncbi:NFACT family protein [Pelotomaculum isophthalicicum JI]|uniref:Rqc2 homolog RqcH n=1 Tax=Pelotomaculum isophthalicicum JI TaxID=947010 RepID=A0A9X4H7V0_9FIRM|nr:NFACT RNA binding domain-containing protein [Pelotomaculum isophthalicicum]MDF9408029.1 NFACT family protein [Pelotomaculum isophthalicicum JI]